MARDKLCGEKGRTSFEFTRQTPRQQAVDLMNLNELTDEALPIGFMDSSASCSGDDASHDFGELTTGWGGGVDIDMLLMEEDFGECAWDSADVSVATDWTPSSDWRSAEWSVNEREIERLQKDAQGLKETLAKMCKLRTSSVRRSLDAENSYHLVKVSGTRWHNEARKQRRLLLRAENENRRLKSEFNIQKDRARSLSRIVTKRAVQLATMQKQFYAAVPRAPKPAHFDDTGALFQLLLAETNAMVGKVDAMKQLLRTKVPLPTRDGSFRESHIKGVQVSDDIIVSTSLCTYCAGDTTEYCRNRQVVRSFTIDSVSVYVSSMVAELMTDSWELADGITAKMHEWQFVSAGDNGTTVQESVAITSFEALSARASCTPSKTLHLAFPYTAESMDFSFSMTDWFIESQLIRKQSRMFRPEKIPSQQHPKSRLHTYPSVHSPTFDLLRTAPLRFPGRLSTSLSRPVLRSTMAAPAPAKHNMKYRYLGNSGLLVSTLGFGSWVTFDGNFGVDVAYDIMVRAFEGGINFFDNAEGYSAGKSEEIMGQVVKKGIDNGVWSREDLVISTKTFFGAKTDCGPNDQGLSHKHIVEGTKASLKRLQMDYVDVVFCHRPEATTPIEETVRAMNFVIEQGWALYWGTSEWKSADIIEACGIADRLGLIRPIVEQPEYHVLERSRVDYDYANLYKKCKYGLATWSPLASGVLTGKYSSGIPEGTRLANAFTKSIQPDLDDRIAKADKLKVIADELGCSLAQLSIAWCALNPNVSTVILGASSIRQLEGNLKANDVIGKITPEIKARIDEIAQFVPTIKENDAFSMMRARWL